MIKEAETQAVIGPSFVFNSEKVTMLEEVYDSSSNFVGFAVWNDGDVKVEDVHERQGVIYAPRVDDGIKKGIIILPTKPEDFKDISELLGEIKKFIRKWVDIPDEFLEFSAWYILLTWVYDRLNVLAYLRTMGDFSTGKSRFLDTVGGLCYRAMNASGATTAAAVARLVELWKGTLILNEADWEKSDERQEIVRILNEGFERRRAVIKAHQDAQKELIYYDVFGPKILSTRRSFDDPALESRCLTCVMEETQRKDILPVLTKEFFEQRQLLVNKLLMFRFKFWEKISEEPIAEVFPKLMEKNIERRLIQATVTFSVLFAHDNELLDKFTTFLDHYQKELRETRSQTMEGMIVNAIIRLGARGTKNISPQLVASTLHEVGWVGDPPYPGTIGKRLKGLKIKTSLTRVDDKPSRIIVWNLEQIKRIITLAFKYIPDLEDVTVATFVTIVTEAVDKRDVVTLYEYLREAGVRGDYPLGAFDTTVTTDILLQTTTVEFLVEMTHRIALPLIDAEGHAKLVGPFECGERVELPTQTANMLERKGFVKIVKESPP